MIAPRVAFVGTAATLAGCLPDDPAKDLVALPVPLPPRPETAVVRAALAAAEPDAVVLLGLAGVDPGMLVGVTAPTLGIALSAGELAAPAAHAVDRVLAADGAAADCAAAAGLDAPAKPRMPAGAAAVWRSAPLPVADALFAPVGDPRQPARIVFLGPSTEERERWLLPVKHRFDVIHAAHGVHGDRLRELLARTDIGLHVDAGADSSYEQRVSLHLAAGHLLVSSPLRPRHGLEPGIDYLEVPRPERLEQVIATALAHPEAYRAVRIRGRRKAEQFRASRVWPRLVGDLLRDITVFGSLA